MNDVQEIFLEAMRQSTLVVGDAEAQLRRRELHRNAVARGGAAHEVTAEMIAKHLGLEVQVVRGWIEDAAP